jgi:hypothetical protein
VTCRCHEPPFHYLNFERSALGTDSFNADVALETCKLCGACWLVYLIEEEHRSRSGRWWRVPITREERPSVTLRTSKETVERAAWCFVGGSFHDSTGRRVNAPIAVR